MNLQTNEDLVQETLNIVYRKYKQIEFRKGILPWAYQVLDYVMQENYKKEKRRETILNENIDEISELYFQTHSFEEEIGQYQLFELVLSALEQLNPLDQAIIKLKLEGYSGEEILKKLELTRATLDVRTHRIIQKLRKMLSKKGVD